MNRQKMIIITRGHLNINFSEFTHTERGFKIFTSLDGANHIVDLYRGEIHLLGIVYKNCSISELETACKGYIETGSISDWFHKFKERIVNGEPLWKSNMNESKR